MLIALLKILFFAGIPLAAGIAALNFPQLFTKVDLNDSKHEATKKRLERCGKCLLIASLFLFVGTLGFILNPVKTKEEILTEQVAELNRHLPMKFENHTTWDHVSLNLGSKTVTYYYSFSGIDLSRIDKEALMSELKEVTIGWVEQMKKKDSQSLKQARMMSELQITLKFVFSDTRSPFKVSFDITPEEYSQDLY